VLETETQQGLLPMRELLAERLVQAGVAALHLEAQEEMAAADQLLQILVE
jgi:hypothetical protein